MKFTLDPMGDGLSRHCLTDFFTDTIELPSTTAIQKKGEENFKKETAHLTEQYPYIGNAWFQKEVSIDPDDVGKPIYLILERTRLTSVWINGNYVSSLDSLCTPHEYDICDFVDSPQITITILVNNKEYKTKGGHLTSPDTQTNWNGITGMLALCVKDNLYVQTINTYPNTDTPSVLLKSTIINKTSTQQTITLCYYGDSVSLHNIERDALSMKYQNIVLQPGYNEIEYVYDIDNNIAFWSEYTPTSITYILVLISLIATMICMLCLGYEVLLQMIIIFTLTMKKHSYVVNMTDLFFLSLGQLLQQ